MPDRLGLRATLLACFALAAVAAAAVTVTGLVSLRSLAGSGEATGAGATTAIAVAGLVAVAAILAIGWAVAGSVTRRQAQAAAEAHTVLDGLARGDLRARADPSTAGQELRPLLEDLNRIVDGLCGPIALATEYARSLGAGEAPRRLPPAWEGGLRDLREALDALARDAAQREKDLQALAAALGLGHAPDGAREARPGNAPTLAALRERVQGLLVPLRQVAGCAEQLGRGEIPPRIGGDRAGEMGRLTRGLDACIDAVQALATDARALAKATVEGRLSARADASRHQGEFREIVSGLNAALDAVVVPLSVTADCVERIARGEIPGHVSEPWAGDLVRLREGLDRCVDAVNTLVHDTDVLVQYALAGKLSIRIDASRHQGDFARIIQGVNQTLEVAGAPVVQSTRVLERLSERDLRARVMGRFMGDHARISDAVNDTSSALHDAIRQVAAAVEQVSGAATQIASSSQSVASGASQQAAALDAISSSIGTVSSMTQKAADNARLASTLAQTARTAAGHGTGAVEQLQGAMARIRQSTEGTGQIIRDVSDIAFQTNLLALNAAVEAARAGEAGRGFAVVAEEVRSLALRAKQAATRTEDLIRQSMKESEEGDVAARKVAETLQQIAQGVSSVTDAVTEIAGLSRDQASRIGEVATAVSEMDKITQQNAASAEESSSAASELSGQAEELAAMAGSFRLQDRTYRIGFSNPSVANSWRRAMLQMLEAEAARHPGVELSCKDAQDDPARQVHEAEELLESGIDLLLVSPAVPDALNGVIERASGRGIPVVVFDRRCTTERYTTTVEIDDVRNGELAAQRLVELLVGKLGAPRGDVVILRAAIGTGPEIDRHEGITSVLARYPEIRVVAQPPTDFQREKGFSAMQEVLRAHPRIDAVVSHDGSATAGAYEAAERAGRAGQMAWVGIDGYNGLLKLIKAGKVDSTVLFPAGLGAEALLAGLRLLQGEQVPKRVKLPNIRVTQENVDAYVAPALPDDAWTY